MTKKMLPQMRRRVLPFSFLLIPVLTLLALLVGGAAYAQGTAQPPVEMADTLRADGKIWVVVGVMTIVTLGVLTYLVRLDGKVGKLEKRVREGGR